MTIVDLQLYRYRLPLAAPLSVGKETLTERSGLLLRVREQDGTEGWGDVAPLPGFSEESLSEAERWGRQLMAALEGAELEKEGPDDVLRALPIGEAPPSVRFAVESAVLELLADVRGETVVQLLGAATETVPVNALITDTTTDLERAADRLRRQGYRAVKLKVGRRPVEADVARVRRLSEALGEELALRLDANRAWTFEQAVDFARALADVSLAYVEEPLQAPDRLPDLVDATGLPVALDETTREIDPDALPDDAPFRAVVLKPTLLGGIAASRRWVRWADRRAIDPVVSASYESGVGLRMLVALAASLSRAPAGLSTYTALETDVLQPRLSLGGAEVQVEQGFASEVDVSVLDPVESVT